MENTVDFKKKISNIKKSEVIVLRDVANFPVYNREFDNPHLVAAFVHSGSGRVIYDTHEVSFGKNELIVVMPNHILCPLENSEDYNVTLIFLSDEFVQEVKYCILSHDYSKFHTDPSCVLTDSQAVKYMKMVDVIENIAGMSTKQLPNRHQLLIYMSDVLFEFVNSFRVMQDMNISKNSRHSALFNRFCDLLAKHYRESREVIFYANILNLSPKYFSRVIFETVGVTAGDWIDQYVTTKAKHILRTRPDLTAQEVGREIGFKDAATFCRFFKRVSRLTPKQYRDEFDVVKNEDEFFA